MSFLGIIVALASIAGAMLSKRLVSHTKPEKIIVQGLVIMLIGTLLATSVQFLPNALQMPTMIVSVFIILFGTGTALPICLSIALGMTLYIADHVTLLMERLILVEQE
ncbi:hypothetical protein LSPH24S_06148 [Lysinibacillus sphaericus]